MNVDLFSIGLFVFGRIDLINLMRFRRQLGPLPPSLDFKGSPAEANAHYEKIVGPLGIGKG